MGNAVLDSVFSGSDGLAKRLMNVFGGTAGVIPTDVVDYDPLTGDEVTLLQSATTVDITVLEQVTKKDTEITNVVMGDYKAMIPNSDYAFSRADVQTTPITFNGLSYKLVEFMPIYSGQEVAANTVFLRRV